MGDTATQDRRATRGRDATSPLEVGGGGWKDIAKRVVAEAKEDHLTLMSAGVAFYFLIALIPSIAALVSIYGFVADPSEVAEQMESFLSAAPTAVQDLVTEQAERVAATSDAAASISAVVSILLALWAASGGCQHLIEAVNLAYDETDDRNFVKRRGLALVMTIGAVVFLAVAIGAIAVLPALLSSTALGDLAQTVIGIARWPLLALVVIGAFSVLYRYAPNRDNPRWQWASPGAIIATLLWVLASVGFSIYVSNFGSYNETYGSLGAVIVVMLWLFITALVMILGAEINAEAERQTAKDTTAGEPRPLGDRGAWSADTVGPGEDGRGGDGTGGGAGAGAAAGSGEVRGTRAGSTTSSSMSLPQRWRRDAGAPGRRHRSPGHDADDRGSWGAVAVSVAGRAVASVTNRRD